MIKYKFLQDCLPLIRHVYLNFSYGQESRSQTHSNTLMLRLRYHLDYIWTHLRDELLDTPTCEDFFNQVI